MKITYSPMHQSKHAKLCVIFIINKVKEIYNNWKGISTAIEICCPYAIPMWNILSFNILCIAQMQYWTVQYRRQTIAITIICHSQHHAGCVFTFTHGKTGQSSCYCVADNVWGICVGLGFNDPDSEPCALSRPGGCPSFTLWCPITTVPF